MPPPSIGTPDPTCQAPHASQAHDHRKPAGCRLTTLSRVPNQSKARQSDFAPLQGHAIADLPSAPDAPGPRHRKTGRMQVHNALGSTGPKQSVLTNGPRYADAHLPAAPDAIGTGIVANARVQIDDAFGRARPQQGMIVAHSHLSTARSIPHLRCRTTLGVQIHHALVCVRPYPRVLTSLCIGTDYGGVARLLPIEDSYANRIRVQDNDVIVHAAGGRRHQKHASDQGKDSSPALMTLLPP